MRRPIPLLRVGLAVFLAGTIAFAGALAPADTRAGSYTVSACSPFPSSGPWQQVGASGLLSGNQCGGPQTGGPGANGNPCGGGEPVASANQGALYGEDDTTATGTNIPGGTAAGWSFAAPPGTTIIAVNDYRNLCTQNGGDLVPGLFATSAGGLTPLDTCPATFQNHYACTSPVGACPAGCSASGLAATGLFFGVVCQLQGSDQYCLPGSTNYQFAVATLYSATVTLSQPSGPAVSGLGGPLWAGGVASGAVPVTFSATDPSGIQQLSVGATTVLESCDHTRLVPCPQFANGSGIVTVDTTRLADGPTQAQLSVQDTAGNTTVVTSPSLIIDNQGPPAPRTLSAAPASTGTNRIQLAWSDPPNPPQPVTGAFAQLCQTSCSPPLAVSAGGSAQLTAPGPGTYSVRLWLTDTVGKGSAQNAATTTVTLPLAGSTGPGGRPHRPTLRIMHRLRGHRLTLTVRLPAGVSGPVTYTLTAYRGKQRVAHEKRRVASRRAATVTTFVLGRNELHATNLVIRASAAHATTAVASVHPTRTRSSLPQAPASPSR